MTSTNWGCKLASVGHGHARIAVHLGPHWMADLASAVLCLSQRCRDRCTLGVRSVFEPNVRKRTLFDISCEFYVLWGNVKYRIPARGDRAEIWSLPTWRRAHPTGREASLDGQGAVGTIAGATREKPTIFRSRYAQWPAHLHAFGSSHSSRVNIAKQIHCRKHQRSWGDGDFVDIDRLELCGSKLASKNVKFVRCQSLTRCWYVDIKRGSEDEIAIKCTGPSEVSNANVPSAGTNRLTMTSGAGIWLKSRSCTVGTFVTVTLR
jgi:hypothetical protein